jgi:hypothetical protein
VRLDRIDEVPRTTEVHRFGKLGFGIRDRRDNRCAVHHDVGLHERDEATHRVGVGEVTGFEADAFRDALGEEVGCDDLNPAPCERPDDVCADFARGAGE